MSNERRSGSADREWWRGAVIYQVYREVSLTAMGTGSAICAGITAKLDYIASLGVDCFGWRPFLSRR